MSTHEIICQKYSIGIKQKEKYFSYLVTQCAEVLSTNYLVNE